MAYSIADNVRNIPPVTRFFTISSIICCLVIALGGDVDLILLNNDKIHQIWTQLRYAVGTGDIRQILSLLFWTVLQGHRFLTTFLTPSGMLIGSRYLALLDIYGFYTFACHLESSVGKFKGNFPDCLWFTLLTGTIIVITTFVVDIVFPWHFPLHHLMMLSCVTYLWSRYLKNATINFIGLVPIKGFFLPFFNLFLKLLLEGEQLVVNCIIGMVGGYLYQCIQSDTLPIYNLMPGSYARFTAGSRGGHRVGMQFGEPATMGGYQADYIEDSIFDKGYLKAPRWLYSLLKYPYNNTKSSTAFFPPERPLSAQRKTPTRNTNTFAGEGLVFRGKGHRLGS